MKTRIIALFTLTGLLLASATASIADSNQQGAPSSKTTVNKSSGHPETTGKSFGSSSPKSTVNPPSSSSTRATTYTISPT